MSCTNARCSGSLITQWKVENEHASYCSLDVFKKAEDFLREFYKQSNRFEIKISTLSLIATVN